MKSQKDNGGRPVWHRAASFAATAHDGNMARDGITPYVAHPARVAMTVSLRFGCEDEDVIAAAFLHDVLEKTSTQLPELVERFGDRIASMVDHLSKDPVRGDDAYYDRLLGCDWGTRLVKLADALDHLEETQGTSVDKIMKAQRALMLASGDELPMQRGRECVSTAIAKCQAVQGR